MNNGKFVALSYLVDALFFIEKVRVSVQARLSHLKRAEREDKEAEDLKAKTQDLEDYITERVAFYIESHPAYDWFSRVKGVGRENIAKVVALIDIEKATHISSLWKWFGFTPDSKREKGKKLDFNIKGKSMCWRLATSLLRAKGKFYDYYLNEKEKFILKKQAEGFEVKPQAKIKKKDKKVISEGHVHNYALRKMIKLFLACLWLEWRKAEGLPLSKPYAIDKLGHNSFIKPEEMVDKSSSSRKP